MEVEAAAWPFEESEEAAQLLWREVTCRDHWESRGQWQKRVLFLKNAFREALQSPGGICLESAEATRLRVLSVSFYNVKYLRCSYDGSDLMTDISRLDPDCN